ncbi:MAG: sigma-54 dependent transcriptional regulator [Myxococcota bacterium]
MIALLDLERRGLVRAALESSDAAVCEIAQVDRAIASIEEGTLTGLIIETNHLCPHTQRVLHAASARSLPTLVVARDRDVATAVEALHTGATDYLCSPFQYEALQRAIGRLRGASAQRLSADVSEPFITANPEMRSTVELARSVAASDATILIEGESGTGKELVAQLIHRSSPRRDRELVSVNCAALPPGLLESELFGHERGAFTGAVSRMIGKFELAHRNTLLLDEIGELELSLQAKLLRILQEREVQRLGAPRPIRIDFRLVVTTNRDLAAEVRAGRFREDLFYRLQVLPIRLIPLRDRPEDIPLLVDHFLRDHARRGRPLPAIGQETLEALRGYAWPGNVRELENLIERLVLTRPDHDVKPRELGFTRDPAPARVHQEPPRPPGTTLREMERWMILETLKRLEGNRTHAARELGISLRTLRNKINEYQIFDPATLPRTGTVRAPAVSRRDGQISPTAL